tara:strand:- start:809 stop:1960 length:1152 start_codon:yes stop_codon:yes gene_type:complete
MNSYSSNKRFYGLDALRAIAMLMGIVLHSALPYVSFNIPDWPAEKSSSEPITIIFQFIHLWRMPLFFILSGFFSNLLITRNDLSYWWKNRILRVLFPLIIFSPLMMATLPWIWIFGYTRTFDFVLSSEGYPYHLWFLWHLVIFLVISVILKLYSLIFIKILVAIKLNILIKILSNINNYVLKFLFYSKIPILFILFISFLSLGESGTELVTNPLLSGMYFIFGYQIYNFYNLQNLVKYWKYYFLISIFSFILHTLIDTGIFNFDFEAQPIYWIPFILIKNLNSVFFSLFLIGFFELKFSHLNNQIRIFSDSAYWIYLIHLPIVTFITFFMFRYNIPIELKFIISILFSSIISYLSYKYLVRPTYLGLLLNGKKQKFNWKIFDD